MSPNELHYSVYAHINKVNGMMYIGCTGKVPPSLRWSYGAGYSNGQIKFYEAIKQFGWNGFEHKIIQTEMSKEDALKLEEELIAKFDTVHNGYNSAYGGKLNRLSEASKQKLREQRLGDKNPNFNPNKIHVYVRKKEKVFANSRLKFDNYTFEPTEKSRDKRKSIEYRNFHSKRMLGEKNPNFGKHTWTYGKKLTEEQKQKMYEAWTDDRRALISERQKGGKNAQAKKVFCEKNGVIYDTIVEAARMNNISEKTVSECCNGRVKNPKIKFSFVKEGDINVST